MRRIKQEKQTTTDGMEIFSKYNPNGYITSYFYTDDNGETTQSRTYTYNKMDQLTKQVWKFKYLGNSETRTYIYTKWDKYNNALLYKIILKDDNGVNQTTEYSNKYVYYKDGNLKQLVSTYKKEGDEEYINESRKELKKYSTINAPRGRCSSGG